MRGAAPVPVLKHDDSMLLQHTIIVLHCPSRRDLVAPSEKSAQLLIQISVDRAVRFPHCTQPEVICPSDQCPVDTTDHIREGIMICRTQYMLQLRFRALNNLALT